MSALELAPDPDEAPRAHPRAATPDEDGTALDAPISPAEVVQIYRAAEADIRHGCSLIAGACNTLTARVAGRHAVSLEDAHRRSFNFHDVEPSLVHLRRTMWKALVERTQVRKLMSVAAWKELEKQLDGEEPPEISIANLEGLVNKIKHDGPKMLEDAVKEVFNFLRPRGSAYKTNTKFELGERVILSGWISREWPGWRIQYHYGQEATALENVFRMLDGKVRTSDDRYQSELQGAVATCKSGEECRGETDYFAFRGHRKGTLHLRFKRMDLVRRLNVIAGGARLKPVDNEEEDQ